MHSIKLACCVSIHTENIAVLRSARPFDDRAMLLRRIAQPQTDEDQRRDDSDGRDDLTDEIEVLEDQNGLLDES